MNQASSNTRQPLKRGMFNGIDQCSVYGVEIQGSDGKLGMAAVTPERYQECSAELSGSDQTRTLQW